MKEVEPNKNKKFNAKVLLIIAACLVILIGAVGFDFFKSQAEYDDTAIAMGTVINIKLYGPDGQNTSSSVKNEISSLENTELSRNVNDSDIGKINLAKGKATLVSSETAQIITQSNKLSNDCKGAFDISIGSITKLWDFGGDNQRVPSKEEIQAYLPSVGYSNVSVNGNSVTIDKNQALDLGAVGKGVACDRIKSLLQSTKTKSAVISVGGSLLLYGKRDFTIGIINPTDDTKSMGNLKLSDTCVSTSGNYEKTFVKDGVTYHHILDARTGYPANSDLSSVTIVCKSGFLSDALSTSCYILGYNNSLYLLKKYDAQAVFIFKDKSVKYTDGLSHIFTITDNSFKVNL